MPPPDKQALLHELRHRVAADLLALERRQRDAQEGSTHEESRSEHAKDTRATEQSYLARGLADRVGSLRRAAAALASMKPRQFGVDDPIAVTALVTLATQTDDEHQAGSECWWLVPSAGGFELALDGTRIKTLTPTSPLGQALLGLTTGDAGVIKTPRGHRGFDVLDVS